VDGAAVIRAFSAQHTLFRRLKTLLSKQQHAYFLTCTAQSWLAIRLELIGTLIVTGACLNAVYQHMTAGATATFAGLAGLAISYALSATQSLNWSVRMASDMEAAMVAVERIKEYTKLDSEGSRKTIVDDRLGGNWPVLGEIKFQGVELKYRPELPLVLQGLDFTIPAGSSVGVVGRTGAGKSSLMVALMRIVELTEGRILIDDVDTRTVGLAKLRSSIAVIPQDPVLFSGTVRSNLDPFQGHSDDTLFDALEQVGLSNPKGSGSSSNNLLSLANARVESLDDAIMEGGTNFSVGQRQLIVIARALLSGCKIVIMDEATASIDAKTDEAIQKVLRTKFANATCITVAHRLNTIMDSDYILVMHQGKAAEFDTPKNLLQKGGMFCDLVEAARSS
jgi:ABC-type multidrug transport system fused ATPase/permease subunit